MKSHYIALLSAFIACSSIAMESGNQNQESSRWFPSLQHLAAQDMAEKIRAKVAQDADVLKAVNMLTVENVRNKILNHFASLDLPEDVTDAVLQAYIRLPRSYTTITKITHFNLCPNGKWLVVANNGQETGEGLLLWYEKKANQPWECTRFARTKNLIENIFWNTDNASYAIIRGNKRAIKMVPGNCEVLDIPGDLAAFYTEHNIVPTVHYRSLTGHTVIKKIEDDTIKTHDSFSSLDEVVDFIVNVSAHSPNQ